MIIDELFPNPTVTQVIFEIKFPVLFSIENKIGKLQERIIKEFPDAALLYRHRITTVVDVGSHKIRQPTEDIENEDWGQKVWQFQAKKPYRLNVTSSSLDISSKQHKTYRNPKGEHRFRDIIEFVLKNFFEVVTVPIIKRVGLRYIDNCFLPKIIGKKSFKEYYNTTFPLTRFDISKAEYMEFVTRLKRNKYNLKYVESFKLIEGKPVYNIDFDGYAINIKPNKCLETTDKLHDIIKKEYFNTIREPVKELMRKSKTIKKEVKK